MLIRQEETSDHTEVYHLIKDAFATAEHADGSEQDLVAALRKNKDAFIPELSLVAVDDGKIIGHILFTKMKVGDDIVLALAPLSVRPAYQKQGVGTALIREGHRIAKDLGYPYSVVLGSETYYPRVGYLPAEAFHISIPEGIPAQNYMVIKLSDHAKPICGEVSYAKEFGM